MAGAGQKGAITIATNMAGRGTDIKLGRRPRPHHQSRRTADHRHRASRVPAYRPPAERPFGPSGRSGPLDLLPLAGRRPHAAVRLRPHRPLDGQGRRRGGRGHLPSLGHRRHQPGPEAGGAAELPGPETAARVRRRHEPAARGGLLADGLFALERGEQLKAEATRMVDGRAWSGWCATMLGDAKNPQEFDRSGLQSALTMQFLVSADDAGRSGQGARPQRHDRGRPSRGASHADPQGRVPDRVREDHRAARRGHAGALGA